VRYSHSNDEFQEKMGHLRFLLAVARSAKLWIMPYSIAAEMLPPCPLPSGTGSAPGVGLRTRTSFALQGSNGVELLNFSPVIALGSSRLKTGDKRVNALLELTKIGNQISQLLSIEIGDVRHLTLWLQ
jgi:hypothetical protein